MFQVIGVHCRMGMGRTGSMLACYLAKCKNLTAEEAIQEIRRLRPGSIETEDQEKVVAEFVKSL